MPTISGLSGSKTEGSSLTLTGSGFGSKPTAAPLVWEKFTGGAKTSALTNNATGGEMVYSETSIKRPRRSNSARADYTKDSGGDGQWCSFQYNDDTAAKWYVSWWVYLPSTWHWGTTGSGGGDDGLSNIKIVRFFPTGPNYTNIDAVLHSFDNFNWRRAYEWQTGVDDDYISGVPDFDDTFTLGQWHNFRCEYGENSVIDAANGVFRIWVDGLKVLDDTSVVTNKTGDSGGWKLKRPYVIGFWDSWGYDGPASTMYLYYADITVDESWARVEFGNAATYNACSHLEFQPATAWSGSSVTVNTNYGSFNEGDPIWIYLTDENGNRSAAFPLSESVDPGPDPTPPPDGGDEVKTHSVTVALKVVTTKPPVPPPTEADFSLTVSPAECIIVPGETATYQVTVVPVGNFDSVVRFSVSGAGTGTSETFDPPTVRGAGVSTLRVVSKSSSGLGTFQTVITGTTE